MGPLFSSMSNKKEIPVGTIPNKSNISNNKGSVSQDVPVRIISDKSAGGIISNTSNNINKSSHGNTSSSNTQVYVLSKLPAKSNLKT